MIRESLTSLQLTRIPEELEYDENYLAGIIHALIKTPNNFKDYFTIEE